MNVIKSYVCNKQNYDEQVSGLEHRLHPPATNTKLPANQTRDVPSVQPIRTEHLDGADFVRAEANLLSNNFVFNRNRSRNARAAYRHCDTDELVIISTRYVNGKTKF